LTQTEHPKTPSSQYYLPLQLENVTPDSKQYALMGSSIADPQSIIAERLVKMFENQGLSSTLKHHFGLEALLREWIALALLKRDFALLGKASDLALKFGMNMDRIVSKAFKDDVTGLTGGRIGSAAVKESCGLTPSLPSSLLPYISHPSCSSFGEMVVRNRWIMIRETTQAVTKFYCSPMFEKNVLLHASMSQLYSETFADVFALIFPDDHYLDFLEYLVRQIASHQTGAEACPVRVPSKIRLLGATWGNGTPSMGNVQTLDVEMMFASVQTRDTHLVRSLHAVCCSLILRTF
jgi:hypothetical protein